VGYIVLQCATVGYIELEWIIESYIGLQRATVATVCYSGL
jgi:hypothetical protein